MPKKDRTWGPLTIQGYDSSGQAWAWWKPYEDNHKPELVDKVDRIFLDPRFNSPQDVVEVDYLGKRGGLFQGRQHRLIEASPIRRQAPCPHFGICGGCSFQHLPYQAQCHVKETMIRECFAGIGDGVEFPPLIHAPSEFRYRNKMEFTAAQRSWQEKAPVPAPASGSDGAEPNADQDTPGSLGFFVPYSGNKVLDIGGCLLQTVHADAILGWFRGYARRKAWQFFHHKTHEGFFRTLLIRSLQDGQTLVMPIFAQDRPEEIRACLDELRRHFPLITSLWYLINPKMNDTYADLVPVFHSGRETLTENLDGLEFGIGPQTFFQVNSVQCMRLYRRVLELACIEPDSVVYDLYCGVGTLSCLAARKAAQVVGVEYVESSVNLARTYSAAAGLGNTRFIAGDMKDILNPEFYKVHGKPDCIITDPPRAGMHAQVCRQLVLEPVKRIVYVSCNMESLKRDLAILQNGYTLKLIQGIDLMPQTPHVELVAVLEAHQGV